MNRHVRNSGTTLVEMILALTLGAAILGAAGTILARVVALNSAATDHLHGVTALSNLGRQFRSDVHTASGATASSAAGRPAKLTLDVADGRQIEYEITSSGLVRVETGEGRPERREAFVLRGMRVLDLRTNVDDDQIVSIVISRVTSRPDQQDVVRGPFEITAVAPRPRPTESTP